MWHKDSMWIGVGTPEEAVMNRLKPLDPPSCPSHVRAMVRSIETRRSPAAQLRGYVEAALMVAASTLLGLALAPNWGNSAVDLLYLPAVVAAAALAGLGPSLFAAAASALAYNFFFTAPYLTFRIQDPNDLVTVTVLLGVAGVTSQLAASVRKQARRAEANASRNATIASLARSLLGCAEREEAYAATARELASIFECNAVLVAGSPQLSLLSSAPTAMPLAPSDMAVAAMVLESGDRAGRGVDRAVPTEWQFHPVRSGNTVIAALGLARDDGRPAVGRDQLPLLDNLLDQVALALERSRLEVEAREFERTRARDQVRTALVASIGQDLKPSIKAIVEAMPKIRRSGPDDKEAVWLVNSEALRMERYVSNLLDLGPETDERPLQIDGVEIDLFRRVVSRDGVEIHLTPKEFGVLAELSKHPGRVLTHAHLLRSVWGPAQEGQIDYLRVAIRALRQKIERVPSRPELIVNEPAVGYRLKLSQT